MNNDLISRSALYHKVFFHTYPTKILDNEHKVLNEVLRLIDNAPTVEVGYLTNCANCERVEKIRAKKPQGWISVSERLPEDMQRVLIWFEYYRYGDFNCMYQTYGFGYVCDGKWSPFINGETGWQDYRIIAWQPLPEPYKEGDAE